jgi:hypothetical protein
MKLKIDNHFTMTIEQVEGFSGTVVIEIHTPKNLKFKEYLFTASNLMVMFSRYQRELEADTSCDLLEYQNRRSELNDSE